MLGTAETQLSTIKPELTLDFGKPTTVKYIEVYLYPGSEGNMILELVVY